MADPAQVSLIARPELWIAVAFVAFFVVIWKPLRSSLLGGLDARAERIRRELDEAQRLREEAQGLLADFQRKQRDAIQEADAIVARAKSEAERLQREAKAKLDSDLKRREEQALHDEQVERGLRFRLGRLDQHRAVHDQREVHGHRVVALVDHRLGEVERGDAGALSQRRRTAPRACRAVAERRRRHHVLQPART
jgi:F0F1-type ATP synthase membrane subunit b/b'